MQIDELDSLSPGDSITEDSPGLPQIPNLPVSIPGVSQNPISNPSVDAFTKTIQAQLDAEPTNPLGQTIITGGTPAILDMPDVQEKPTFFQQIGHEFWKMSELGQAGQFVHDAFSEPDGDIPPEGWTAMNQEYVKGFPQQYWHYITQSRSPKDLEARQNHVREQMEQDEKYADGSMVATLIGGGLGVLTSPTTYMFPMIAGAKYATLPQTIFGSLSKAAGPALIDSAVREGLIQSNRAGGNLQQAAIDTMADFVFADALMGAGAALGYAGRLGNLWESRKMVNLVHEGVNINPVIDDKGRVTGHKVSAAPGFNLSAAKLDAAQTYVNAQMAKTGLYATPFLGKQLEKVTFWSPVLKATKSPFNATKEFFNRIAPHGIITQGEMEGVARPDTAFEIASKYKDDGIVLAHDIKNLFYKANGITGGSNTGNAWKNFKQTVTNGQTITEEDFGKQVREAIYDKNFKSSHTEVHEAASKLIEYFEKIGFDYKEAKGEEGNFLDPRTSWKYLPQNYNISAMINRPREWVELTANAFKEQDELIMSVMKPLNAAENELNAIKTKLSGIDKTHADFKSLTHQKRTLRKRFNAEKDKLVAMARDNEDLHILLEDRVMFNSQEAEQLRQLRQPIEDIARKIDKQESVIESLKKSRKKAEKEKVGEASKKLDELRAEQERINTELQDKIARGEIDSKFYKQGFAEFELHSPDIKPKFRSLFESDAHRESVAQQIFDSITNSSPMDLMHNVLGGRGVEGFSSPSSLKKRTHYVSSSIYNQGGFLDPDVTKSLVAYAEMMGKQIGFKRAFPEYAQEFGDHGIIRHFKEEHDALRAKIAAEPQTPERDKKLKKLNKEYKSSQQLMQDTYKVFMGTYNAGQNRTLQRFSANMKNLVASARLGSVPIYQISELAGIVLKSGLMPFMSHGLKPLLKAATMTQSEEEKEAIKGYAASCALAMNHLSMSTAQLMTEKGSMSYVATGGLWDTVGVATENLAHTSGNVFGINFLANNNERLAANTYQSDIMRYMHKFKEGTLTPKEKTKLAHIGLQPEQWADRFIENYHGAGGWEQDGGYQSLFYKWEDSEASNRMSMSVRRAVRETIITNDPFSKPYLFANNPILSMAFMFHGWAYGALTRYTVPFMQRPDAEHMLGVSFIVGLNLMTEPLLRVANGKEPFQDDETWFQAAFKAVDYSGILGPSLSFVQDINKLSNNTLFPSLTTERAKGNPTVAGGFGPVFSYMNDALGVAIHANKGDLTKGDMMKLYRLLPYANALYIRNPVNRFINGSNLPDTRSQAQPWAVYSMLHGDKG